MKRRNILLAIGASLGGGFLGITRFDLLKGLPGGEDTTQPTEPNKTEIQTDFTTPESTVETFAAAVKHDKQKTINESFHPEIRRVGAEFVINGSHLQNSDIEGDVEKLDREELINLDTFSNDIQRGTEIDSPEYGTNYRAIRYETTNGTNDEAILFVVKEGDRWYIYD